MCSGYAFEITTPAVARILSAIDVDLDYRSITCCRKDSTEITQKDRRNILIACVKAPVRHIVITHGTDTIIETAKYLQDAAKWRKVFACLQSATQGLTCVH